MPLEPRNTVRFPETADGYDPLALRLPDWRSRRRPSSLHWSRPWGGLQPASVSQLEACDCPNHNISSLRLFAASFGAALPIAIPVATTDVASARGISIGCRPPSRANTLAVVKPSDGCAMIDGGLDWLVAKYAIASATLLSRAWGVGDEPGLATLEIRERAIRAVI